jgi:hypothetical protein
MSDYDDSPLVHCFYYQIEYIISYIFQLQFLYYSTINQLS